MRTDNFISLDFVFEQICNYCDVDASVDLRRLIGSGPVFHLQELQEQILQAICDNTYPSFDKDGKPVNVWNAKMGYTAVADLIIDATERVTNKKKEKDNG